MIKEQETTILSVVEAWTAQGYKVVGVTTSGETLELTPTGLEEDQAIELVDAVREFMGNESKLLAEVEGFVGDYVGTKIFNFD